jgi:acetylornithine deacetylase/succinyl-diaminopimelate desuccinylase-like protein
VKELIRLKSRGLKEALIKFYAKLGSIEVKPGCIGEFMDIVTGEMKALNFDKVTKDKSGNLIGIIKGYRNKESLVLLSHVSAVSATRQKIEGLHGNDMVRFKSGIITSIYTGALLKRAMLPLEGDLIVCCIPRMECCAFGIKYLFDNFLKDKTKKIKGVILCEPTGFNINLGHKGRMEYEIVVKGKLNKNFLENRGINMLGTMFPLINELEKISKELPSDFNLGRSDLRIKDVRYSGYRPQEEMNEFRIVVDRGFVPEETKRFILDKAKNLAKAVYKQETDITVNALLVKEKIRTYTGLKLLSKKEFKPWAMDGHRPFALNSLKSITESGFKSDFGYWQDIVTEGSYTYAQLGIPTIGFGPGSENDLDPAEKTLGIDKLEKAVYGQALIIHRNIGMPIFGWSTDEI